MKTNKETILVATLVVLLGLASAHVASAQNHLDPDIGFQPEVQQPLSYEQGDGTVVRTMGQPEMFQLLITRLGRPEMTVALPTEIAQINSIDPAVDNKAVVIGMINGSAYQIEIVDTVNARIVDEFLAYSPTLSPNGQFIAFVKMYPAHFVDGVSDYVMLYDLTRSASGNRPPGVTTDQEIDVGMPVYPPNIQTTDGNTGLPEAEINRVMSDMFFWAPDSSKFAFPAEHMVPQDTNGRVDKNESPQMVEVDLILANPSREKTTVTALSAMVCAASSCEHHLDGVEFGEDSIKAQFDGFSSKAGQKRTLEAKFNQFRAQEADQGRGTRPR